MSGYFGHGGLKMIELIFIDFDVNNENFTLKVCTHVVYLYVYVRLKV